MSKKRRTPNVVEPELRTIVEMADNRTMDGLLQAPTKGDVPNDAIKLMMFSYSLDGNARVWGSCNSLTELEYHLEEVYKATRDQLDWVNPEG
nr:hypothetical protein [Tanacetum cinerariifolium]